MQNIPDNLIQFLGPYGAMVNDPINGEPVGWGHKILQHVGEELWAELGKYGNLVYISHDRSQAPYWVILTKQVTREECLAKHGDITEEGFGPRGGWKYVAFGGVKYGFKGLKSVKEELPLGHPTVVVK